MPAENYLQEQEHTVLAWELAARVQGAGYDNAERDSAPSAAPEAPASAFDTFSVLVR
jgi:hypothetical protein